MEKLHRHSSSCPHKPLLMYLDVHKPRKIKETPKQHPRGKNKKAGHHSYTSLERLVQDEEVERRKRKGRRGRYFVLGEGGELRCSLNCEDKSRAVLGKGQEEMPSARGQSRKQAQRSHRPEKDPGKNLNPVAPRLSPVDLVLDKAGRPFDRAGRPLMIHKLDRKPKNHQG